MVLPELFTCGYSDLGSVYRNAEDAESGASVRFFARLARKLGIFVAYGFPERGPVAGVFDSANLVGPDTAVATYRKRNLVETTLEYRVFAAGAEDLPVVGLADLGSGWPSAGTSAFPRSRPGAPTSSWRPPLGVSRGRPSTPSPAPPAPPTSAYIWRAPTR